MIMFVAFLATGCSKKNQKKTGRQPEETKGQGAQVSIHFVVLASDIVLKEDPSAVRGEGKLQTVILSLGMEKNNCPWGWM